MYIVFQVPIHFKWCQVHLILFLESTTTINIDNRGGFMWRTVHIFGNKNEVKKEKSGRREEEKSGREKKKRGVVGGALHWVAKRFREQLNSLTSFDLF